MHHDQTAPRLLTIAAVMLAAAVMLKLVASARWFDLYGAAAIALAGAFPILATLMRGLERRHRSRWLAALVVGPIVAAALVQIGYWTAFFSSTKAGIPLGLGRLMLQINAGFIGWLLLALGVLATAYVLWRAIGPPRRITR